MQAHAGNNDLVAGTQHPDNGNNDDEKGDEGNSNNMVDNRWITNNMIDNSTHQKTAHCFWTGCYYWQKKPWTI